VAHYDDQFERFDTAVAPAACIVCETMLPEAVDGTLSAAEQRIFDAHIAGCTACSLELAEAQRGAAWLGMLKSTPPEPPAHLLARILAETSEAALHQTSEAAMPVSAVSIATPLMSDETAHAWGTRSFVATQDMRDETAHAWGTRRVGLGARLLAFRRTFSGAFSMEHAQSLFQPRLAMTAAMAFFSIALTLNMIGVRLRDLHAENFTPSGLRRTVADTTASLTRSFQNNRSVYQVESRLSEINQDDASRREGEPAR
jgi:hypothetical protein